MNSVPHLSPTIYHLATPYKQRAKRDLVIDERCFGIFSTERGGGVFRLGGGISFSPLLIPFRFFGNHLSSITKLENPLYP